MTTIDCHPEPLGEESLYEHRSSAVSHGILRGAQDDSRAPTPKLGVGQAKSRCQINVK